MLVDKKQICIDEPVKSIGGIPIISGYRKQVSKKYETEVLLLTNSDNFYNLTFEVNYYLERLKFEHIVILYNGNSELFDKLSKVLECYGGQVELHFIEGRPSQTGLYNEYIEKSHSRWVLPIDDDEYLYISDKYDNNINLLLASQKIKYDKYSFSCLCCISHKSVFRVNPEIPYYKNYHFCLPFTHDENDTIKTMINTDIYHKYVPDDIEKVPMDNFLKLSDILYSKYDSMGTVHNPISHDGNNYIHAKNLSNGEINVGRVIRRRFETLDNIDCCIFHFKYRSREEWRKKIVQFSIIDSSRDYINCCYNIKKYKEIYRTTNLLDVSNLFNIFEV